MNRRWITRAVGLALLAVCAPLLTGCAHGPLGHWRHGCGKPACAPPPPPVRPACGPPPVYPVRPGCFTPRPGPAVLPQPLPAGPQPVVPVLPPPAAVVPPPMLPQAVGPPAPVLGKPAVVLSPGRLIAPTGSDVTLVAGVCQKDGKFTTGEPIEWSMGRAGVGQFVAPAAGKHHGHLQQLLSTDGSPERMDPTFARSVSASRDLRLTRGTVSPIDDVVVKSGQAWMNVTSETEGTSFVTAYAPSVKPWDLRRQTAVIHWVDAQWQFPPQAINPAGTTHVLTTSVTRHSNGAPIPGWVVRYELAGGPPAGFGPQRLPAVEVSTDSFGQASVELAQTAANPGTNPINIQIIRPVDPSTGTPERLVVGAGVTTKTWGPTAAQGQPTVTLRCTGPAQAGVGAAAVYTIEATNIGRTPLDNAVVSTQIPPQFSFLSSNPQAEVIGQTLSWRLGRLDPMTPQRIDVNLRPTLPGATNFCATIQAPGNAAAQHCTSTTILPAQSLELNVGLERGGDRVVVGEPFVAMATVVNRSDTAVQGVTVQDVVEDGLASDGGVNPSVQSIGDLGPGQSRSVRLPMRALRAGTLCHTVTVSTQNGVASSQKHCVTAVDAGGPTQADLTVRLTGPAQTTVGQMSEFVIDVTNPGRAPLTGVVARFDSHQALAPREALDFAAQGNEILWNVGTLAGGETKQTRIRCIGTEPTTGAWVSVGVVTAEGLRRSDRRTLDILPGGGFGTPTPAQGPATLTLSIDDTVDPVQRGGQTMYIVRLRNDGDRELTEIVLEVTLAPGMTLLESSRTPTRFRTEGTRLIFDPVLRLRPLETADFRLVTRTDAPGDARITATTRSRETAEPVTAEQATRVLP